MVKTITFQLTLAQHCNFVVKFIKIHDICKHKNKISLKKESFTSIWNYHYSFIPNQPFCFFQGNSCSHKCPVRVTRRNSPSRKAANMPTTGISAVFPKYVLTKRRIYFSSLSVPSPLYLYNKERTAVKNSTIRPRTFPPAAFSDSPSTSPARCIPASASGNRVCHCCMSSMFTSLLAMA